MPQYVDSPFQVPVLLQDGVATYLYGSYNQHQGNTVINVSQVALATNVATITGQIISGEVPTVGAPISVSQTVTGSGEFNVNRAAVTAVSFNTAGFGTVSYALTASNVTAVADFGQAIVEVPEVAETLAANNSIAVVVNAAQGQITLPLAVTFPTIPTAATVTLQVAIRNRNSEFTNTTTVVTVAAGAITAGPVVQATLQRGYVYRLAVSGITGSGTIVAKVG